jgi:hypothetical protein
MEAVVAGASMDADVALSKARKVHFSDANNILARPGVTLARLTVEDPRFTPRGTPQEFADAAAGLARMMPDGKVNYDVLLDAVAAGLVNFGAAKVAVADSPQSKVTLWKKVAAQASQALTALKQMPEKSPSATSARAKINSLVDVATREIVAPISGENPDVAGVSPRPDELFRWRQDNARQSDLLIKDDAGSQVSYPRQTPRR